MQKENVIILWGTSISPYVKKVKIALEEKKIRYLQREILPKKLQLLKGESANQIFDQVSPLGKIPVLVHEGYSIQDSSNIILYLEEKYPEERSLSNKTSPENNGELRWLDYFAQNILSKTTYKIFFHFKVLNKNTFTLNKEEEAEFKENISYIEDICDRYSWIASDSFNIPDISLGVQFMALENTPYAVNKSQFPKLYSYLSKIKKRPSFKKVYS